MDSQGSNSNYNANISMEPDASIALIGDQQQPHKRNADNKNFIEDLNRDNQSREGVHQASPLKDHHSNRNRPPPAYKSPEKSAFLPDESTSVPMDKNDPLNDEEINRFWTDDEDDDGNDEENVKSLSPIARPIVAIQNGAKFIYNGIMKITHGHLVGGIFLIGFLVYFGLAMNYSFGDEGSIRLLVCTVFGVSLILWRLIYPRAKKYAVSFYGRSELTARDKAAFDKFRFISRWFLYTILAALILWVLVEEGRNRPSNLRSLPGLAIFIVIPLIFSTRPGKINWHTIYWSIGLQFLFALAVLKSEDGREVIIWIQSRLDEFFASTHEGSKLLFGDSYKDHYMIFGALPIVFFTNATLTMLFYLGVIQFVVKIIGGFLYFILDTSPIESTAVSAGIFMEGITALLALRPYLPSLSKSQLFIVITQAFSSLGGAYLAILSGMGISLEYLIPAMVVSAPATFTVCKLMVPETKWSLEKDKGKDMGSQENPAKKQYKNVLDAANSGALAMLGLVGNIAVVAFAFFSYIEWINNTLTWFGDRVGIEKLTIELISSYLLYPVALMMGIELDDCRNVGMLLGYRIGINNIIAFFKLRQLQGNRQAYEQYMVATNYSGPVTYTRDDIVLDLMNITLENGFITHRSEAIVTYSLCGFSSFLSVAITTGIMAALVPNRKQFITGMILPALIAGNIANCMTGCFASIFY